MLICDEPVSALDVSVQAEALNLLTTLQSQLGLSYVFIAHDLSVVRHVSDRVAVMYLGRIVEQGDEEQIYEHPTHPYTQALLSAVAEPDRALDPAAGAATTRGLAMRRDRIILTGEVPDPSNPPSGCRFRTRCWKARDVCTTDVPLLIDRPDDAAGHLSACHFADTSPG